MRGTSALLSAFWTLLFLFIHPIIAATPAPDFLPQGFFFDWNPPGTTVPIPTTQQCQTLHITWSRGSTAVGPNPTSPYSLQIFTSTSVVPITVPAGDGTSFDFQVPFAPGTQYQLCMWGSNGVSGGCQAIYTVTTNITTSTPTCPNVTYPATALGVDAAVINGAFSQYGWIPQCTDIQVNPKNGTGPYTLMIAPTLHPPLNITWPGGAQNWTVSFTHGFPFFISVTDSQGNGWAQGPLHSGDSPDTSCLDTTHSGSSGKSTNVAVTIGAAVGGIVIGLLAGAAGIVVFRRSRASKQLRPRADLTRDSQLSSNITHSPPVSIPSPGNITSGNGLEYLVEPFAMPSPSSDPSVPLLPGSTVRSGVTSQPDGVSASGSDPVDQSSGRRTNVYVVHHDGGRAPVTVYTEEGADVVELPPRYPEGSTSAPSESDGSRDTNRRRDRKARGPRSPTSPTSPTS